MEEVTVRPVDHREHSQHQLFTDLHWNDPDTADVNLILRDLTVIQTHKIKLGVSPVLRKLLNSLDARLDSRPCISLSDFNSNAVISLLNFIYKGEVVLERRSEVQREFLKLCQTLRLNPSITKIRGCQQDGSGSEAEEAPRQIASEEGKDEGCELTNVDEINDGGRTGKEDEDRDVCDTLILDNSDEETPDHISDYLSSLMSEPSNEEKEEEGFEEEQESTFKMPDSFDIPQEYIKEMVPRASSAVSNPFQTSDEEEEGMKKEVNEDNGEAEVAGGSADNFHDTETTKNNEVEQITYQSGESIRPRSHKKSNKKAHNPKMDRRTLQAKLFGESDSEQEDTKKETEGMGEGEKNVCTSDSEESKHKAFTAKDPKEELDKKGEEDEKKLLGSTDAEETKSKAFTPNDSIESLEKKNAKGGDKKGSLNCEENRQKALIQNESKEDLEKKRKRMKQKLKEEEAEQKRDSEKLKKKKRRHKEYSPQKQREGKARTPSKEHECHSSCSCVHRVLEEAQSDWLVPDNHITYASSDSDDEPVTPVKKPKKPIIGESSTEEEEDGHSGDEEARRKLQAERKVALALRGGGDVLSRMRGKLSVSCQNSPRLMMIDLWQYQAQLDSSDSSDGETRRPVIQDSDSSSSSDAPSPPVRKFSPSKPQREDSPSHSSRKKTKVKMRQSPEKRSIEPESVEVWTPAMYQKWDAGTLKSKDKKRKHMVGSDSDSRVKVKPGFNRSMSYEGKKMAEQQGKVAVQRSSSSIPTLESLGIAHNYGFHTSTGTAKAVSSMPKIPKLKKQENL